MYIQASLSRQRRPAVRRAELRVLVWMPCLLSLLECSLSTLVYPLVAVTSYWSLFKLS